MPELTIELVPRTCWYSNVRSEVSRKDWETCKDYVKARSGSRCEICGGRGSRYPVDCHEVWQYDDQTHVQTLLDLIALCPACHEVKHIGRAFAVGNGPRAIGHLMRVNYMSADQAEAYIKLAFAVFDERSEHAWALDISFLERELGIVPS